MGDRAARGHLRGRRRLYLGLGHRRRAVCGSRVSRLSAAFGGIFDFGVCVTLGERLANIPKGERCHNLLYRRA